ncbi:MAG TPA: hypothetical protein VFH38_07395 [Jatrophihabitans sp.]|nr:hypothetical protein [Jatrophihabitans sp.]
MSQLTRPARRVTALLGTAAAVAALAIAVPAEGHAAPAVPSATTHPNCPRPLPLRQVHQGTRATGWTTSHGTTPRPFSVRVLGVLKDGISPGIDLIAIRINSPAIKRAGGTWAGMSGSPIYARNGRLLGALSYSFSFGPSHTAGVTPAGAMYKLFGFGHRSAPAAALPAHVSLSPQLRDRLVAAGDATPSQAAAGMSPIPTPISVSGVPADQLDRIHKQVDKLVAGPFMLESGTGVAATAKASPKRIRPGAPFASAISSGDITFAGIGTTTAVCHGQALAFGHPMLSAGPTSMTAHAARVLYIQPETFGGPFVMANVGGRVGMVNQDRTVGLRARLGRAPAHPTRIVTHTSASTGLHRTGRTVATIKDWLPDVAANAVYGSLISTLQKDGSGSAAISYTITGRRLGGAPFVLHRSDRLADRFDIAFAAGDIIYGTVSRIVYNRYRSVRITGVSVTTHAVDRFRQWTVKGAQVRRGGQWVALRGAHLRVHHGATLRLRAKLVQTNQIAPSRYVSLELHVPDSARGHGDLQVVGGEELSSNPSGAHSFTGLLARLRHAPHNASVVASLNLFSGNRHGPASRQAVRLGRAATGDVSGQIRVI